MNVKDLIPASTLAKNYGVKSLIYGAAGSGKTPLVKTAPRPLLLMVETGGLSLKDATNVPSFEALTRKKCDEFFDWFFKSNEAKNFDTLCIDSLSHMCQIYLEDAKRTNKHGLQAYGEMAVNVFDIVKLLINTPNKHLYLICKQIISDENGISKKRPFFDGKALPVLIPHEMDEVFHIGDYLIPGLPTETRAIRTKESFDAVARDRSGKLNEFEPPNLTDIFNKIMRG